jgi:hypothetical protein
MRGQHCDPSPHAVSKPDAEEQPPPCTREQLLAVPCPTCGAAAGAYCEERSGKVLLLPHHHADRFWAARAALNAIDN